MKVAAIIAAGGVGARLQLSDAAPRPSGQRLQLSDAAPRPSGQRLQTPIHKPFISLAGRPMIAWTLNIFEKSPSVEEVVVAIHPDDMVRLWTLIQRYRFGKVKAVVAGGKSRMASVAQGLKVLSEKARWVLVHDAARPLVTPAILESTIRAARHSGAAIAAVPVIPTIKEARGSWVAATLDRRKLWAVQTPQVFRRDLLERAHREGQRKGLEATDDAGLVEALGHRVRLVLGSDKNIKVTKPEDIVVAEALLKNVHSGWIIVHNKTRYHEP